MRFLTVEELVARRDCSAWSPEWIQRAVFFARAGQPPARQVEDLPNLYNEGTLLLYRMGFPDLARRACGAGLQLRRSPNGQAHATFIIQQWINLTRLDAAADLPGRCERRLGYLEAALERAGSLVSPDDVRKAKVICLVERTALLLFRADYQAICALKKTVPSSIEPEVEACVIESEIRCLMKMGLREQALDHVCRGLLSSHDDRILGALMVLLATLRPLARDEADLLLAMMSRGIAKRPIHNVQVGEFLLRNSHPENRIHLADLVEPLWKQSILVGDVMTPRFLSQFCNFARQARNASQAVVHPASYSPLDAASVISEQLGLLLRQAGHQ